LADVFLGFDQQFWTSRQSAMIFDGKIICQWGFKQHTGKQWGILGIDRLTILMSMS
jgi:hypothetical protein